MESSIDSKIRKSFTGKEFDNDGASGDDDNGMNLYYFGKRYYDPEIIKWLSTDPDEQFFDSYAYTGNNFNPINALDVDGLEIQVLTNPARGIKGLHHVFIYSTVTGDKLGRSGVSGKARGKEGERGGNVSKSTKIGTVTIPQGKTEKELMEELKKDESTLNESRVYFPPFDDCWTALDKFLKKHGLTWQKTSSYKGKTSADESLKSFAQSALSSLKSLQQKAKRAIRKAKRKLKRKLKKDEKDKK